MNDMREKPIQNNPMSAGCSIAVDGCERVCCPAKPGPSLGVFSGQPHALRAPGTSLWASIIRLPV